MRINVAASDRKHTVTSVLAREHVEIEDNANDDEQILSALGYKQEFRRDLSILQSACVSFSVLGLLPSVASALTFSLGYAGTGGLIWGWLAAGLMIQSTAFSLAELTSSLPTAGGLYYASAVLAPEGWGPMASWFTGWSSFCGFAVGPCSLTYALSAMILSAAEIANPDFVGQTWQLYLIFLLLLTIQGLISMQSTKVIGTINLLAAVLNTVVVFIFIIWMPAGSISTPKTNNSYTVWTTFTNGTDWPIGWATIMGFLTAIFTMSGFDVPLHLSEECSNSNVSSPRAIIMTAQMGLWLGFAVILVIGYTVQDISSVIASQWGQPFGSLCVQVLGTQAGLAMFGILMVTQFSCSIGLLVTVSRILFAYSRDGAVLGSSFWARIDTRTRTPVFATWGVVGIAALLGLLAFAGPVAINSVFAIAAIGQYTAFTTPIALKLFFDKGRFRPGPWNLGKFSKPVNAIACIWWLIIAPALCFPAFTGADLTPMTMNWTIVIYGGVMFLAMSYYAIWGRKWFKGPRVNVVHVNDATPGPASDIVVNGSEKVARP